MVDRSHLPYFSSRSLPLMNPSSHLSVKQFFGFLFISFFCHAFVFGGLSFLPDFQSSRVKPEVVRVDLVAFTPSDTSNVEILKPSAAVVPEKVPAPLEKKSTPRPIKKAPDMGLKEKNKILKKKVVGTKIKPTKPKQSKKKKKVESDSEAVLQRAREDIARRVEMEKENQIEKALERLTRRVEEQANSPSDDAVMGGSTLASKGNNEARPIDLYKMVLQSSIERNWVFNDALARMDQRLETRILIKILGSGEIRDITYETRSGNRYLDDSAKKAIQKANPLPKLPDGFNSYDVVIIFTPKGLK